MQTVAVVAAVVVGLGAWIWFFQERMVFFPSSAVTGDPGDAGLAFEEVRLPVPGGGEIHGWYVPSELGRCTVLFCHGNAGNVSDRIETLALLNGLGCNTFIFDYRGYGRSTGRPSEANTYEDARAAWDHLVRDRGAAPERIVVMGRSLGSGPATWLAARLRPRALILESAFTSVAAMARRLYPYLPGFLARIRYANLERVREIECPLLVAHSPQDEVVPYDMGRALHEAARVPKRFLPLRGDHGDGFLATGGAYVEGLDDFLAELAGL